MKQFFVTSLSLSLLIATTAQAALPVNCRQAAKTASEKLTYACADVVSKIQAVRAADGQEVYRVELGSSEDDGDGGIVADSFILVFDSNSCAKISAKPLGGACTNN